MAKLRFVKEATPRGGAGRRCAEWCRTMAEEASTHVHMYMYTCTRDRPQSSSCGTPRSWSWSSTSARAQMARRLALPALFAVAQSLQLHIPVARRDATRRDVTRLMGAAALWLAPMSTPAAEAPPTFTLKGIPGLSALNEAPRPNAELGVIDVSGSPTDFGMFVTPGYGQRGAPLVPVGGAGSLSMPPGFAVRFGVGLHPGYGEQGYASGIVSAMSGSV